MLSRPIYPSGPESMYARTLRCPIELDDFQLCGKAPLSPGHSIESQRFGFRIVASLTIGAGYIGITHQREPGAGDSNRAGPYTCR